MLSAAAREVRTVVILGHTGFVGARLSARLAGEGWDVRGGSLPRPDLTRLDETMRFAERHLDETTAVVLLSAIKREVEETLEAFERNVAIAANVARAVRARPVARLIFFSSAAVYGEDVQNTYITEETPIDPRSHYGAAKFASERILRKEIAEAGRASLLCLRPPHIYGPGDPGVGYGPTAFLRKAWTGAPVVLWGEGEEMREFVFVDDVVEAVRRLLPSRVEGVLNLATGVPRSFRDALRIAEGLVGRPVTVRTRPRTKRKVDNAFETARLRAALPDLRFTTLEEGMERTFEAIRAKAS